MGVSIAIVRRGKKALIDGAYKAGVFKEMEDIERHLNYFGCGTSLDEALFFKKKQ